MMYSLKPWHGCHKISLPLKLVYLFVLRCTGTYSYIPVCTGMYWYVLVHTTMYSFHEGTYQYIEVRTRTYVYIRVHTRTWRFLPFPKRCKQVSNPQSSAYYAQSLPLRYGVRTSIPLMIQCDLSVFMICFCQTPCPSPGG